MATKRLLVIGAGGALGLETARCAAEQEFEVTATYRTKRAGVEDAIKDCGARPVQADLRNPGVIKSLLEGADAALFTPILSVSRFAADLVRDDQKAVFFSSNNVSIDPQADDYAKLIAAESDVLSAAPHACILRPTMIYGYPGDGNLSVLMDKMRRWPITPMLGSGGALQQPVYYKDLARVALACLFDESASGTARAVAGPAPVTKKALYEAVASAAGTAPIITSLPAAPGALALYLMERAGLRLPVKSAQLRRADFDKIPMGAHPILTQTSLDDGLRALAADNLK